MTRRPLDTSSYLEFGAPEERRAWLAEHFQQPKGIWVRILKRRVSLPGLHYEEAVKEAIC